MEYILIFISAIFVNNIVLSQFLGICPFLGVSKKIDTSLGMSAAVAFVLTLATIVTWLVQKYVLDAFGLQYLQTIAFILGCFRLAVSADHRLHSRHRLIGADGGDHTEEGVACALSGIRHLPAADYDQLCRVRCGYPGDPERLQPFGVCGLCLLYSHRLWTGIDGLCWYA